MTEQQIIQQLKKGTPFEGLGGVRLVQAQPDKVLETPGYGKGKPDTILTLDFDGIPVTIYCEVKAQVTPKLLEQVGPWLVRAKTLSPEKTCALVCGFLSPASQRYCEQNGIDFIDLCGNVLLRIPGKVLVQRLGRPNIYRERQPFRNAFRGASSRVVRVLLQFPRCRWTVTAIQKELSQESGRQNRAKAFELSASSISKTIQSLQEDLLVRRDGLQIVIPEPAQLLFRWAEEYARIIRRARQNSWTCKNPFGFDVQSSVEALTSKFENLDALVTGAAAANLTAPFVNIDRMDVLVLRNESGEALRALKNEQGTGPDFFFSYPYDAGVFMYSRQVGNISFASDIQTYLDCRARAGRDASQADYLFSNVIEKQWNAL